MHPYIAERSIPEPNSGCYLWLGSIRGQGYGSACYNKTKSSAHRISYALNCGPIPRGLQVLHRCDVRLCVNPGHLFLGTHQQNIADRDAKGRTAPVSGLKNPSVKLTEEQVEEIFHAPGIHQHIADRYRVDRSLVSGIKRGAYWPHLNLCKAASHAG